MKHLRKTILPITIICAGLLVYALLPEHEEVPEENNAPELVYYHSDSLEALNWRRKSYMDSLRTGKLDTVIVPYRAIYEKYADSIGCDWRMLAAVAYQESRFNLHAESSRGAVGLMQVKPRTAANFGVSDLHDPDQNICAGSMCLRKIIRKYRTCAPDPEDRLRLTLAAYNAGTGRIEQCIDSLSAHGIEVHRWEDIRDSLPIIDNFNGLETTEFVRKTESYYRLFQTID